MLPSPAKHILIAPLDWGLGHTTRCIPVIRCLLARGHRVTAAGNEAQRQLLTNNIPGLATIPIDGYNVRYHSKGGKFIFSVLHQLPRLAQTIGKEHHWLLQWALDNRPDGIISDNRYGLWHPTIPSVLLTHQPSVITGFGAFADALVRRQHYRFLNRFREIWLADHAGPQNLGGRLSHPKVLPRNARYVGLLSQMKPTPTAASALQHLLVLLSGPEPQRSILQDMLWQQALQHPGRVVFVAGTANAAIPENIPPHVTYRRQLAAHELTPLLEGASYIITRGGYSTLMDLVVLRKKAILIPTPGQTEQEYLAKHLRSAGIFPAYRQDDFILEDALAEAARFPFHPLAAGSVNETIESVLDDWLARL